MLILSRPQTIWGRSPDNQVELSEWVTACFKHCKCIIFINENHCNLIQISQVCFQGLNCIKFSYNIGDA